MFLLPTQEYTVMVVSVTYNHAPYIEDTLKGIIMQQTKFPVVACVLDDCSTDGTTDIVRKYESQYPDLIKGFYFDVNQFSQGKYTFEVLSPWLSKTKYIALCEGDDYWSDPLKLQKQVDFMECHADCTMSFHRVMEHWQDSSDLDKVFFPVEDRKYTGTEIFKQWVVATVSVMTRSEILKQDRLREIFQNKSLIYHDQAFYMYCSLVGNVVGMSDAMAVYRRTNSGYTLSLYAGLKNNLDIIKKYCLHCKTMKEIFGAQLGDEFCKRCDFLFVRKSLNGLFLALCEMNLREASIFLLSAFRCSATETLKSGLSLSYRFITAVLRGKKPSLG